MRTTAVEEIRKAVAACIETGLVLRIAERSEEIARLTGEERERTAKSLLEAGIMARVNIEFGPSLSEQRDIAPTTPPPRVRRVHAGTAKHR